MTNGVLKIKKIHPEVPTPKYMTNGAAGFDISAFFLKGDKVGGEVLLRAGDIVVIPTGLFFEIPPLYEAQVRPRSGLAFKHGIGIVNAPGTIDSDFRGELKVCLINHAREDFLIKHGERIAQVVVSKVSVLNIQEVETLSPTDRGEGGFGHTGR